MVQFKVYCKALRSKVFASLLTLVLASVFTSSILRADMIDSLDELFPSPKKEEAPTKPESSPDSSMPENDNKVSSEKAVKEPSKGDKGNDKPASNPVSKKPTASSKATANERSKKPIRLESQGRTTYARSGGLIHLRKNVVITQADLRLRADEAKVHIDEEKKDNSIQKVEVNGDVKITKSDADPSKRVTARGQQGLFLNSQQEITLSGNARLWRGGHLIRGKKITYNLVTGLISVDEAVGVVQPNDDK